MESALIWFGIYIILVMELGAIAPPVGLNCFIIQGIAKDIPLGTIYKGALPFVITILVAITLIYFFPQIVIVPSEPTVEAVTAMMFSIGKIIDEVTLAVSLVSYAGVLAIMLLNVGDVFADQVLHQTDHRARTRSRKSCCC